MLIIVLPDLSSQPPRPTTLPAPSSATGTPNTSMDLGSSVLNSSYLNTSRDSVDMSRGDETTSADSTHEELVLTEDKIFATLIRDKSGLGISIAGGRGSSPFHDQEASFRREGKGCTNTKGLGIFISRVTPGGAAERDGKLKVGDRVLTINGVDMEGARHDQAVSMLSGLEKIVRIAVSREVLVPRSEFERRRKKPFGPRPYTGLTLGATSSEGYLANRPSLYAGLYGNRYGGHYQALIPPHFLDASKKPVEHVNGGGDDMTTVKVLISKRDDVEELKARLPPVTLNPRRLGTETETVTKSTFSETTVTRVTKNQFRVTEEVSSGEEKKSPTASLDVRLVKDGGPLGLSIIGGADMSSLPFGCSPENPTATGAGVYISKVVEGGLADRSARLRVGDRILCVNGVDLVDADHQTAVTALVTARDVIDLKIRHDPLPS
ncbi:unnamed protein product, partial [Cyprideis torosa]